MIKNSAQVGVPHFEADDLSRSFTMMQEIYIRGILLHIIANDIIKQFFVIQH